ncbi:autotransporter domain-containing protein [Maricaulaceae bacterium EIL42A08]|nr:autotransporter domain-containing protein [Maricaulaceae bacterium EIL42A08]
MKHIRSLLLASSALGVLAAGTALADEAQEDLQKAAEVNETYTFTADINSIRAAMRPQIIVRDDLDPSADPADDLAASVDADNTWAPVVQLFLRNNNTGGVFFNCTGTLINPRTVLTAAHCVNSSSSEAYGLAGAAPLSILVGFGPDTQDAIFNTIFTGASYSEGGVATSTDVIIHPSSEVSLGGLPFPWADVAMVALDEPITDVPTMAMLFSPLDQLTRVAITGYGTQGTGEFGAGPSLSPFLRLEGENEIGLIGSPADLIDGIFPGFAPSAVSLGFETQTMYWMDFDNPNRANPGEDDCTFTGFGISCPTFQDVLDIDWFDGDALPNEVATAPGDSGSPMIATELADFPLILGVLSGGFDFFGVNNSYSDISFYNPLFPFFEFISANTPYKYVSAVEGDGRWLDPNHWTQDLDPNFYIFDETGALVNGLPEGPEEGVYASDDKVGSILGNDISGNSTADSPFLPPQTSGGATPVSAGAGNAVVGVTVAEPGTGVVYAGDAEPGSGAVVGSDGEPADASVGTSVEAVFSLDAMTRESAASTQDAPNFGANLPQSSVLVGPGSTGFVPDNTDGTPGTAFENPAQYFDVSFSNAGTTTLDSGALIEVDQVTLLNGGATLRIEDNAGLISLIGTNVLLGTLYVEETAALFTPVLVNDLGIVSGSGVIFAESFINRGGIVDPDFVDPSTTFGELTIVGDYTQQGQGVLKIDILDQPGSANSVESLGVLGAANLDGTIWITADAAEQSRGTTYTILEALGGVNGTFANEMTQISAVLSFNLTYNANDVQATVVAADYADVIAGGDINALALAGALDGATSGSSAPSGALGSIVRSLDALPTADALNLALGTIAPSETFVFDQMGNSASRSLTSLFLGRPNATRQAASGLDVSALNIRGNNTPTLLASSAQDTPMRSSQDRMLPDNMTAFIAGDVVFSEDRAAPSGEIDTALVTAGIEARLAPSVVGGVAVTGSWFEAGDDVRSFDGDGVGAAAYLGVAGDIFYANAVLGYMAHSYTSERPVFNGTSVVDATGGTDADQVYAAVEAGMNIDLGRGGEFGPLVRIRTSSTEIEAYTEEGAGAFSVAVADRTVDQTTGTLALSAWTPVTDKLVLSGEFGAELLLEGGDAPTALASLANVAGTPFTLTGVTQDESYLTSRIGAAYQLSQGAIIEAQYERDFNRTDFNYERLMVALRFGF